MELFEVTADERLARLRLFLEREIEQRERMLERHPQRRAEYWMQRIAEGRAALEDVERLRKEIAG